MLRVEPPVGPGDILSDCLEIVRPHFHPALFTPGTICRLQDAVQRLAPIPPYRIGFECRLSAGDAQVDLQQGFVGSATTQDLLTKYMAALVSNSTASLHPAWRRIQSFCSAWCDSSSPLHEGVVDFWLEFDLHDGGGAAPVPSVFFGLNQKASPAMQSFCPATAALEILTGAPLLPGSVTNLRRCFEVCPDGVIVSHLGVMLARETDMVRVNIKHIPADGILSFLRSLEWKANDVELEALLVSLASFTDGITVCLDIGREVAPRVGLECFLNSDFGREARWAGFLQNLVAHGLCSSEKAEALMTWPGYTAPDSISAPWPAALVAQSLQEKPEHFSVISRDLSHVKVTLQPSRHPTAKAYFGFTHSWLKPEIPIAADREVTLARRRKQGVDVSGALGTAVDFLFRARAQTGWWLDFDGFEVSGASDEWVSGYVASAIATLADRRCTRSAEWIWALLKERRSAGGWGWNAALPPDADGTLWALRLAEHLGESGSERAALAHAFLCEHMGPNGGIASYRKDCFTQHLAQTRPRDIGEWFSEHTCITAAAGVIKGFEEKCGSYLRAVQKEDGSWSGYWWPEREYATTLAAEALALSGHPEDQLRIERSVRWASSHIGPAGAACSAAHAGGSAFATALCVRLLGLSQNIECVREPLRRAVRWLLDQQRTDGGWSPAATLYENPAEGPVQLIPETRGVFTTATVITALRNLPQWIGTDGGRCV